MREQRSQEAANPPAEPRVKVVDDQLRDVRGGLAVTRQLRSCHETAQL